MRRQPTRRWQRILGTVVLLQVLAVAGAPARPSAAAPSAAAPPLFIENVGQLAGPARFQLGLGAATLGLAEDGLWLALTDRANSVAAISERPQARVHLRFLGANPHPRLAPQRRLPTQMAYFLGGDPRAWHTNVPVWAGVRYHDLYPGIDLELASAAGELELLMLVRPGANLAAVRLQASGAERLSADARFIRLGTAAGELRLPLPRLVGADRRPLAIGTAAASVQGSIISSPFARAQAAASSRAAAAAPSLEYSSFFGTSGDDEGDTLAVGPDGAAYIGGWTNSSSFPLESSTFGAQGSGIEALVIKLAPVPGAVPAYVAVIGGVNPDYVSGIAVDASGVAYAVGTTASADFPTQAGFDTNGAGIDKTNRDAFVLKLNPDGSQLLYSTFAGGSADERGFEIAIDGQGAAYITGRTSSTNFPTTPGAYDTSANGLADAYALKVGPDGELAYGTYLGGGALDQGNDIAADDTGTAYLTGYTASRDFPTPNGYDASHNGLDDLFVVKLAADGSALEYGTFVGGGDVDHGLSLAVDGAGAVYVAGSSLSTTFPAQPDSYDAGFNGQHDAVVLKLAPNGRALIYATYLGGSLEDFGRAIAIDRQGQAYVVGYTTSTNFPTQGALDDTPNGGNDMFIAALDASGVALSYSSYLGGSEEDQADALALDASGALVITGYSQSADFPLGSGPLDASQNGSNDIVLVRLALASEPPPPVYSISGTIRDQSGSLLANITVQTNTGVSTTSGADGAYQLIGLVPGTYQVSASYPGLVFQPEIIQASITTSDLTNQDFTALVRTYAITGRVVSASTRQGLGNVLVSAGANYSVATGADGSYRLASVPAGQYTLSASYAGYSFEPAAYQVVLESDLVGQDFEAAPLTRFTFVSVTHAPKYACWPDPFEPNDDYDPPSDLVNSRLAVGQPISANLCSDPKSEEDSYLLQVAAPNSVQIELQFPASYVVEANPYAPAVLIYYYHPETATLEQVCHKSSVRIMNWNSQLCERAGGLFKESGDYVVRVYLEVPADAEPGSKPTEPAVPTETYTVLATRE